MEHQIIFPTNLFLIDDFYNSDITAMKRYISDLWKERDYDENWQTRSADLHKKKEFKKFVELVISTSKEILNELNSIISNDKRNINMLIPIRDGLMLCIKNE